MSISLSDRWNGKKTTHPIEPQDVTFMTISQPSCDHNCVVFLGVAGVGKLEIHGAKPKEIEALIKAIEAHKNMAAFSSHEATAQFYNADKLYIDAKSVQSMEAVGRNRVALTFTNPDLSLTVEIPQIPQEKIAKAMHREMGYPQDIDRKALFNAAVEKHNTLNEQAQQAFMIKILTAQIPSTPSPLVNRQPR
jgi:hypothetical protein